MVVGIPERLSDLFGTGVNVRLACRSCKFEDDWAPDALARHLVDIGGSELWAELLHHLRCRRFGCNSTELSVLLLSPGSRAANMPRYVKRLDTATLDAALEVLDIAARRSRGRTVAASDVRLALLIVYRFTRDRDCVRRYWTRASASDRTAAEGLLEPLAVIRQRLVEAGWVAQPVLLDRPRVWPWNSPAPLGWLATSERQR